MTAAGIGRQWVETGRREAGCAQQTHELQVQLIARETELQPLFALVLALALLVAPVRVTVFVRCIWRSPVL